MDHPQIKILQKRIAKLEQDDFDLEAWKDATRAALDNILDPTDKRLHLIDQLKVDYGSWMLRDATSKYNPIETAKKKGKEILEGLIDDLENSMDQFNQVLSVETLEKIHSAKNRKELTELLKKEKKEVLAEALSILLINQ